MGFFAPIGVTFNIQNYVEHETGDPTLGNGDYPNAIDIDYVSREYNSCPTPNASGCTSSSTMIYTGGTTVIFESGIQIIFNGENGQTTQEVVAHEVGHQFNFAHADALDDFQDTTNFDQYCEDHEIIMDEEGRESHFCNDDCYREEVNLMFYKVSPNATFSSEQLETLNCLLHEAYGEQYVNQY